MCNGDPSGKSSGGNGANAGNGDYTSTCPDGPSMNGNGDGNATGKPCAGCVGAADDKNPPGQYRNGSDANSGYECDVKGQPNGGNRGVGVGNPAHTGCQTSETATCPDGSPMPAGGTCPTPPTCPDGSPMPAGGTCPTPPACPDGSPMPAGGTCPTPPTCPDGSAMPANGVCAIEVDPASVSIGAVEGGQVATEVEGVQYTAAAPAPEAVEAVSLATTGVDIAQLVEGSLLLLFAGTLLVVAVRRHHDLVRAAVAPVDR